MILSFSVGTSKNENIDCLVKETYAIMSTQVTCETDHISLLCELRMSSALIFFFLCIFCNLKEKDHIGRSINIKKDMFICEISIIILICQKLVSVQPVQQKINLPLPNQYSS